MDIETIEKAYKLTQELKELEDNLNDITRTKEFDVSNQNVISWI